ncbi:MAG TPA: class I SAM-dependent methyltransferase [Bryobacteraceae bacterium]|nr:class I SAM-dependent methyltransferase [Bryobacteraceae bacterium]
MNWRVKGVVQGVLSILPAGRIINDFLQRTLGGLRNFEANVDSKFIGDWLVFASYLKELGIDPAGMDFLEIGTGWYPTLPVCFYLAGARSCRSFDLHRHLRWELTRRMLLRLEIHLPAIASASNQQLSVVTGRYRRLLECQSLKALMEKANFSYYAPADARNTGLSARSVDIAFSNSVLEHVPSSVIADLMREIRRILRPNGFAMHGANCGDHYAYFDKSITMVNYLTFSQRRWKLWNNDLLYQNRLRARDLVRLAEGAGLKTVFARPTVCPDSLKALPRLALAPEFSGYSPEELCAVSIGLVSQPS